MCYCHDAQLYEYHAKNFPVATASNSSPDFLIYVLLSDALLKPGTHFQCASTSWIRSCSCDSSLVMELAKSWINLMLRSATSLTLSVATKSLNLQHSSEYSVAGRWGGVDRRILSSSEMNRDLSPKRSARRVDSVNHHTVVLMAHAGNTAAQYSGDLPFLLFSDLVDLVLAAPGISFVKLRWINRIKTFGKMSTTLTRL